MQEANWELNKNSKVIILLGEENFKDISTVIRTGTDVDILQYTIIPGIAFYGSEWKFWVIRDRTSKSIKQVVFSHITSSISSIAIGSLYPVMLMISYGTVSASWWELKS